MRLRSRFAEIIITQRRQLERSCSQSSIFWEVPISPPSTIDTSVQLPTPLFSARTADSQFFLPRKNTHTYRVFAMANRTSDSHFV